MHPDESALLAAVCAAPDDDLPRLVYADWCDENGQSERAEFIRGQIELAKLATDCPRRRELAFRCRELTDTSGLRLCDPPHHLGYDRFSRGFVEARELNSSELTDFSELFRHSPLRRLWVNGLFGVDELSAIPVQNHLSSLDLAGNSLDATDLQKLARLEQRFPHLRELGLMLNGMGGGHVTRELCRGPLFQSVSVLRVGGNSFTDADREVLRDHFESRVSFTCERDPDRLYTFQDDEYHFLVGFGQQHTQVLVNLTRYRFWLGIFDHAGFPLETRMSDIPEQSTIDEWLAEFAVMPATIRVRRFKFPDGMGIDDFTRRQIGDLETLEGEDRYWLGRWLSDGQFRWRLGEMPGDDWWINRDGEVTDT